MIIEGIKVLRNDIIYFWSHSNKKLLYLIIIAKKEIIYKNEV